MPGTRAGRPTGGCCECDYGDWTGQELKRLAKEKLWRTVQAQPVGARGSPAASRCRRCRRASVAAVRERDARLEAEHGRRTRSGWRSPTATSIKAILADALGMHLDAFQRIVVDPAACRSSATPRTAPFVLTMNSAAGVARPPGRASRRKRRTPRSSDAVVGRRRRSLAALDRLAL